MNVTHLTIIFYSMFPYPSHKNGNFEGKGRYYSDSESWFSVYFILWDQKSNLQLNEQHFNNILAKIDTEFLDCFSWGSKHSQGHRCQSSCMSSAAPFTFGEFMKASYYKLNSPETPWKLISFFLQLFGHILDYHTRRIQTVFMNVFFSRYELRGRICFWVT